MPVWIIVCYVMIVFRVTRFINADALAEPLRTWVVNRFGVGSMPAYLVTCTWCASVWVALAAVILLILIGDTPVWMLMGLVCGTSMAYGLIMGLYDTLTSDE